MKKVRKSFWRHIMLWAGWMAVAGILAAVLAVVWLHIFVTPRWLQSVIMTQLQRTFNRPVQISGVHVLLHQGIKVRGLKVAQPKGFEGDWLIASDFLIAKYKLWSLLLGRLELREVRLISPRIHILRRSDGAWNLQGLLPSSDSKGGTLSLPLLHAADVLRIERGVLHAQDALRQRSFLIENFELQVNDFNRGSPFALSMAFVNESIVSGKHVQASCRFRGAMSLAGLNPEGSYLSAEKLDILVDGQKIQGSGSLRNFQNPVLELDLKLPQLSSELLSRYAQVPAGISLPPSHWALKVAAQLSGASSEYRLERLTASAGSMRIDVSGVLRPQSGRSQFTLFLPKLPLHEAAAIFKDWAERRITGIAEGQVTWAGSKASLSLDSMALTLRSLSANLSENQRISDAEISIRGDSQMRNFTVIAPRGNYTARGNTFSQVDMDLAVHQGSMEVKKLAATWNTSHLRLQGCVKDIMAPKEVVVDGQIDNLRVDQAFDSISNALAQNKEKKQHRTWLKIFKYSIPKNFPDLQGRLRVNQALSPNFHTQNLELLMDLRDISQGLQKVHGSFRIGFGPGRISNIPQVREVHRILNVLLLPFVYMHEINAKAVLSLDTATPKTMDFNRVYGDFGVQRGLSEVRLLQVDSPQFVAYGDGTVDFPREKVDLRVLMRITQPRGQLPDRLVDTSGRPSMELFLKQDLNKPTPELSLRKMQANDLEDALAAGLKRAKNFPSLEKRWNCGRSL